MKSKNTNHDKIELRSPKVRRTIGKIPSSLVWSGFIVFIVITIILIVALLLVPFPYGNGKTLLNYFLSL